MFGRLRLQLTLWYVGSLLFILFAVGSLVYILVARSLDDQINSSLREVNQQAASTLRALPNASLPPGDGQPAPGEVHDEGEEGEDEDESMEHPFGERDDEFNAVLTADQLLGSTGDVFLVVLDAGANVIANPRQIAMEGLPVAESVALFTERSAVRRDAALSESRVRILTVAVEDERGEPIGYVITGKSLEQRDADLRRLLLLLVIGGGVGLVLASAGGLWVAQLAIHPVRRAFERQREFVADASHELRTPLTVVRANAESLLAKAASGDKEALTDIVAESEHMSRLSGRLLTLARADQGELELHRERVDLHDAVMAAATVGRRLAQERGVAFRAQSEHITLMADADRLRELLLILVDNGVKYTPQGETVTLKGGLADQKAEVVVEDTGIGIAEEHLPRLFDRFYRVDKARSREEGGMGLGLSIARAIVEAHGGSIEIDSALGCGTRVRVTLPSTAAAEE